MYQLIVFLLKRIFRENFTSVQKLRNKINTNIDISRNKNEDINKYAESLQILKLNPEDIKSFLDPEKCIIKTIIKLLIKILKKLNIFFNKKISFYNFEKNLMKK